MVWTANIIVINEIAEGGRNDHPLFYFEESNNFVSDAGLETEGMATSTAKLQESLKQLAGVDILEDGGTAFKSTFQIMRELAGAWDNISDMNRAAIIEQVAGKRGASYFSSMMMNWEDAENAYKEAMNSAGSAVKENEAFLDSIEGRKRVFKSAFESLSNNLLNGDLVKTGISAGTQIVKGLDFAIKHTGGGTGLLIGGILGKTIVSSLTKFSGAGLTETFGNIRALKDSLGVKGAAKSIFSSFTASLTPLQATLGAVAAAAAAVGIAYKVWDSSTVQLSEAQEQLNDSLSNSTSAQQHISNIEEQIAKNEEKISQIRSSGVTTITKSAELANLYRQNELLKTQSQYEQTIADTENSRAAESARASLGISTGYVNLKTPNGYGLASDYKLDKFSQFLYSLPIPFMSHDETITDSEYAMKIADEYSIAQQRLKDAQEGRFFNDKIYGYSEEAKKNKAEYEREKELYGDYFLESFDTQQEAVEFWQGQVSEFGNEYNAVLKQQYQYLEAFTDKNTGKALKGYEEDFQEVRNNINSLKYKNTTSDEDFLSYLLGSSSDYDKLSTELANLALNDGFVEGWEDSSKALKQFISEANSAGMTDAAEKIERIWKSMSTGTPNSALALVEDNYESLTLSMQEYETRSANVFKAAKAGFGVGGLDIESRNTLFGSYQKAMMNTQNGIQLDYRLFDSARAKNASKEIGENLLELRTQQKLLSTLQKSYADINNKINSSYGLSKAPLIAEYQERANELKQEMATVKSNISNLKAARTELNGLNSEVYQYMSVADGAYNQSAVADSMGDSFKALKEAADTGKKTSASAREFMNLWTNQDLTGMKNSEIATQWDTAFANMEKYYDAQYNSQGNLEKYVLNEGKIISEINKAGDVMDKTFITAGKDIEMTSSHVLNLAKVMGISESAVTEMVNALADYGYNVSFIDTAEDIESIAAKADPSKTVEYLERYNEEIIKLRANGINSNQTKFGNIDLNNRQAIHWTEEELQKQQASSEYGVQVGDVSTVLGSWDKFGEAEIPIAYSPILQTENGAKLLSQNTVSEYLWGIIDKATESGVELNKENLLKLDTEGLEFDGLQIKNLIADIGDTAEKTAQSMHSLGENGALDLNVKALDSYIDDIQEARNATESGAELDALDAEMTKALFVRKQITRSSETNGVLGIDAEEEVGAVQDGVKALQDLQEAYESYEVAKEARSKYSIDAKLEEEEGLYEASLSRLSDYVKEQNLEAKIGLDTDASSEEIGEKLKQLLSEGGVGEINGKLDISNVDITGGEVAQEKASEAAQRIAEAINTTLTESKSALDEYLGEGNYQVELDAQGNIVSVTVSDTAEIPEVPVEGEIQGYETKMPDVSSRVYEEKITNNQVNTTETLTAEVNGKESVDEFTSSVQSVPKETTADVNADVTGTEDVNELVSAMGGVYDKSALITAITSGLEAVSALASAIAGVHSKDVTINVGASVSGVAQQFLGKVGINGTAHFGGTAYSTGNWGVRKNETALLGEVGSELVVNPKTGTWHTVDRASFENLPKGAIVFNHKQTEELFKNGYVTSGGGHGRVVGSLLNGTAHASGTALAEGSDTKNNDVDFISIRLKRLADALDRLISTAELYENFEKKNLDTQQAIAKAYEGVNENLAAYNAYMAKANSIGLDESYASKVRNGSMDIENIEDDDLRTKITDYQKWYEAAEAVQDTIISLKKQVNELAKQKFDNITKSYDSFLSLVNAIHDKYSAMNDLFEEMEGRQSIEYLQEMGGQNNSAISRLRGQISELLTELHFQEANNAPMWSEAWVEAQAKINEVKKELYEARLELQEVNNEIRKTNWLDYNNLTSQLEAYGDEVDTVYNLIGDLNSFESANAAITQNGISKLGTLTSSLKNARQQVANYETAYEALNKELALGVINEQEYQDELLDLQKSQRGAVESVKKYKDEIISLVKDGINAETEAFQKLIEARQKDLSKQKEADDYAKTIADKTKDINRIRAQVAALSGDDSQATKARIKSLQADLLEMEEDLAETRRDHEYNTMVEAYEEEVEHFGEIQDDKIEALTESLAKQNDIISSALTLARDNYSTIYGQLNDLVEEYGVSLSDNLIDPWVEATDAINEYKAALQRATSNASISSGGYVSETDNQSITHYGDNGVGRGNYRSLYDGTAIMDSAHIHGKVLGFVPKGSIAESDGAIHDGWIHIKYNGVWGWTSIGNLKRAARGTFNASKGLTLTDEYGLGSEAIITKQGVLRQLNSGDMVFNASQKSMLWKLSQMNVPAMIGDLGASVGMLSRLGGNSDGSTNISMNYGSLLTVNGNVDRDALPDLEGICKAASEYIKKDITSTFRKIGVK